MNETDDSGIPKGRPVCQARHTMNMRTSEVASDILDSISRADIEKVKVISGEDLLHSVDSLNELIRKGEVDSSKMMVGSLGVEKLYPSIDVIKAGEICRDRVLGSELNIEGIDYRWGLIYLALTATPREKVDLRLQGILPRKLSKSGKKPTILTVEKDETVERWWYPVSPNKLTPEAKKKVQAGIIQQMIKVVFL